MIPPDRASRPGEEYRTVIIGFLIWDENIFRILGGVVWCEIEH